MTENRVVKFSTIPGITGTATFDQSGVYRYSLTRIWGDWKELPFESARTVLWIMMNPSTADENHLDPTIRRCVRFSRDWGFDGLEIVNVFSFRATNPKNMPVEVAERLGPWNRVAISRAIRRSNLIIAAWGDTGHCAPTVRSVLAEAEKQGKIVKALAVNRSGAPKHPLYVASSAKPVAYTLS